MKKLKRINTERGKKLLLENTDKETEKRDKNKETTSNNKGKK
jgi:hypothetical protein